MFSNLVSFDEIIEGVKDSTDISNLQNFYPKLRRFVYRIERDIGFGSAAVLKKVKYVLNGNYQIKLPEDLVAIESIGSCRNGICPGDYVIQGNFLFVCNGNVKEFELVYYSLLCDGSGNPVTTQNHYEAIIAGITYFLYKPKRFRDKGSQSNAQGYSIEYNDRVAEARGDDAFPDTEEQWERLSSLMNMSRKGVLLYDNDKSCFCCIDTTIMDNQIKNSDVVNYWQFDNLSQNITFAPNIDEEFLKLKKSESIDNFLNGTLISYDKIGRIAFAIQNVTEDKYRITDVFNIDITDVVFETYYNTVLRIQVYISKEYYSYGNIYFKLINN